ncbi:hypothetical protein GCM10011588_31860 [Nocardia jinanensis]|uniref:Short chain dehydrogenase n=1 Tax=Nocardia jinanensis TaxID=382504 RepID=A0A917VSR3_9NOCA|nr:hypothetical protein GCM10011588_31860 [Nocardia jinanensis]
MGYAADLFDLTDRVVLVTGGSRGPGRERAFAAARRGADVVVGAALYLISDASSDTSAATLRVGGGIS